LHTIIIPWLHWFSLVPIELPILAPVSCKCVWTFVKSNLRANAISKRSMGILEGVCGRVPG
jgi:hypothetical protein